MKLGLVGRILAIEAAAFVLAAIALPLIVLQVPRPQAVLYLALAIGGLFVLSGVLIAVRIARPLSHIIDVAESATMPEDALLPEAAATDEITRLTRALNRMTRRLRERQQGLVDTVNELRAANEALVRSDRLASVGQLAAGVAHEIGNPLQTLQGFLALTRAPSTKPEERAEYLALMEGELERIHRLVRDLVDYARPSSSSVGPVDPRAPVEAALALVTPQPRFRQVQLSRELDADVGLVLADEPRLVQVILNLLLNAADAVDGKGRVSVRLSVSETDPAYAELRVSDDGPGIAPALLTQVFEPFFSTKPRGEGAGLGLAISRSIVSSLGGSLTVSSAPAPGLGGAGGATFTVRLRRA